MRSLLAVLAAGVCLLAGGAHGQDAPSRHGAHHADPVAPRGAAGQDVQAASRKGTSRAYESPFAGYRRFDPQEPAKPWRAANEEVRAAGGHVGVMKDAAGHTGQSKGGNK